LSVSPTRPRSPRGSASRDPCQWSEIRYTSHFQPWHDNPTARRAVKWKVGVIVGMQCAVCGKKPVLGNQICRRGKAKYLGGIGRKVTGISRRAFKPNLQRIQVEMNGETKRARVCVACIRSGKVKRPMKRKLFQMPSL
jgi:large subunit ribosomal protein L28